MAWDAEPLSEIERYLFDLRGFVVRHGVLDQDALRRLNEGLDAGDLGSAMPFEIPWTDGLAALAVHPAALGPVTWLCGDNLRLDHAYGLRQNRGDGHDLVLHGSPNTPIDHYEWHPFGNPVSGMVVASWALSDQPAGGGGFRCVPGSHKANFPAPQDLPEELVHEQVDLRAGDVLLFTEALTHGTLPWTQDHERRSLLFKYTPGSLAWTKPEEVRRQLLPFVHAVGDGLRVLLEPPYTGDRWPGTY